MHIVILAGGKGKRLKAGMPKAFVNLCGKLLLDYSLKAAIELGQDKQISAILPLGYTTSLNHIQHFETTNRYLGDIVKSLEIARDADKLLLLNADAVLVTSAHLKAFLELAQNYHDSAVVWPQVSRKCFGPEYKGTDFHPLLGNKSIATGNIVLIQPRLINLQAIRKLAQGGFWEKLWIFGSHNLIPAFTCGIPLAKAETIFSRLIQCSISLPICHIPELGFDIDHPTDLTVAERILQSQTPVPIG